jgi:hypothetical protein
MQEVIGIPDHVLENLNNQISLIEYGRVLFRKKDFYKMIMYIVNKSRNKIIIYRNNK